MRAAVAAAKMTTSPSPGTADDHDKRVGELDPGVPVGQCKRTWVIEFILGERYSRCHSGHLRLASDDDHAAAHAAEVLRKGTAPARTLAIGSRRLASLPLS